MTNTYMVFYKPLSKSTTSIATNIAGHCNVVSHYHVMSGPWQILTEAHTTWQNLTYVWHHWAELVQY